MSRSVARPSIAATGRPRTTGSSHSVRHRTASNARFLGIRSLRRRAAEAPPSPRTPTSACTRCASWRGCASGPRRPWAFGLTGGAFERVGRQGSPNGPCTLARACNIADRRQPRRHLRASVLQAPRRGNLPQEAGLRSGSAAGYPRRISIWQWSLEPHDSGSLIARTAMESRRQREANTKSS